MKAVEFKSRIRNLQIPIPSEMQRQLKSNKDVRVIVLIDEPEPYDDLTFQQTAQEQFFKGYSDSDSVYDNNAMTEIKDILKLSVEERLHLVQTIWDSISEEAEEASISDEHKAILNERLDSYKKNPENNVSWEEVKKKVKKLL